MSTTNPLNVADELDAALALVTYSIEYADTHGGCPPAVRGVTRHGVAEAKAKLHDLMLASKIEERRLFKQEIEMEHWKRGDKSLLDYYRMLKHNSNRIKKLTAQRKEAE